MAKNGNFRFLLLELILADHLADLPPSRGANNGTFRFLLLELILADQVAPADHLAPADHGTLNLQIYPPVEASSVHE